MVLVFTRAPRVWLQAMEMPRSLLLLAGDREDLYVVHLKDRQR
jgi:hypothetical protein